MTRPEIMAELAQKSLREIDMDFGRYPGYRASQAKGVLCRGWFTAEADAAPVTTAAHFQPGVTTRVTARFSNFTSEPGRHDGCWNVRGMATAFHLRDGTQTDITALRMPRFFVGDAKTFVRWQRTMVRTSFGLPRLGFWSIPYAFRGVTPLVGIRQFRPLCRVDSLAGYRYNSLHAFRWMKDGGAQYVRYSWIPEIPERRMRAWGRRWWRAPHRPDPDFLRTELMERMQQWPVRFRLEAQLAEDGDDVDHANKKWPRKRQRITVGTLDLTELGNWDFDGGGPLRFEPTRMTEGIEFPEDDSLLMLRKHVYQMSAKRRSQGTPAPAPTAIPVFPPKPALPLDPDRKKRVNDRDEIDVCYDVDEVEGGRPLLLIMGLACPMTWWHRDFCRMLQKRGFRVIRFDNRDCGNSTRVRRRVGFRSLFMALAFRRAPYKIDDMADDAAGLLDKLDFREAHVMGISLGGMVAQALAIHHPDKVLSLTCINSSPNMRRWPPSRWPTHRVRTRLLRPQPTGSRTKWIEYSMPLWRVMSGPDFPPEEEEHVRGLLGLQWAWSRGANRDGDLRQMLAVLAARDRTRDLRDLRKPAVVIYGSEDPFVRPAGGEDTVNAIEGARGIRLDGVGHYTPRRTWPIVCDAVEWVARQAELRARRPVPGGDGASPDRIAPHERLHDQAPRGGA